MDENQTNDPRKRQGKDSKSKIIERIKLDIESKTGLSIEKLKLWMPEYTLFREGLRNTTATNKALCAAMGISESAGQEYEKELEKDRAIWRVEKVSCPFSCGKVYTLTTNFRKDPNFNPRFDYKPSSL